MTHVHIHPGAAKLATLYLFIIMAISLFFSFNVYQLSVQEFDRGFRHQSGVISISGNPANEEGQSFAIGPETRLFINPELLFEDARNHVLQRLMIINVLIFVGGGFLSYYLALRTLKPIEEAHEAQNRFTADASHELRTPITAIRTENEVTLMNSKLTLAGAKKQLRSNIEELEKLSALSDGLLRLARLENNGLEKHPITTKEFIKPALARARSLAKKKNIKISYTQKVDVRIAGDKESLEEVVFILLDNAIKYSPKGSTIVVEVSARQKSLLIQVIDSGPGIDSSELPYIFERFYRADQSRTQQETKGYGLGLAIAKNIVDLHKGTITAASHNKQGTTFTVTLPRK